MKMKKNIVILILLFSSLNSFAQNDKEDAKLFFKTVIKSYFDTCTFFIESLNDSIIPIGMHEGFYFPKNKIDYNKICTNISRLKTAFKSIKNYDDAYKIIVYNKNEFTSKTKDDVWKDSFLLKNEEVGFVMTFLSFYKKLFTNNDYLIAGNFPKNGNIKEVLDGMFWFIARKCENSWKVIAIRE